MFNAQAFLDAYNIDYKTSGKNVSKGWLGTRCPFCHDSSYHLGFSLTKEMEFAKCWRCGGHWIPKVISRILSVPIKEAVEIKSRYSTPAKTTPYESTPCKPKNTHLDLPRGCTPLKPAHKEYLLSRKFDPALLVKEWGLLATDSTGNYAHRILAPIIFKGQIISYQCRAIYTWQSIPYLPCRKEDEVLPYKTIVYGFDKAVVNTFKKAVVVEGITDVWRLGAGAVALFGKKYTKEQVWLLAESFRKIFIILDPDVEDNYTDKLAADLRLLGCTAEVIAIFHTDPGDLSQSDARAIMRDLGF